MGGIKTVVRLSQREKLAAAQPATGLFLHGTRARRKQADETKQFSAIKG